MSKGLTIIDKDYTQWVENLSVRYRQSQIKAAVRVNRELLKYYWELGRDIEEMHVEERWGQSVIKNLSVDLQLKNPNSTGLSRTNIYYAKKFYLLYSQHLKVVPQTVGQLEDENGPQSAEDSSEVVPQPVGQLKEMLFSIPWGHHRYLIDRYGTEPEKAFFYVKKTMKEGWSRDVLLNFMDSGLYEREGKALTNFTRTLPDEASDLAQELTKDPYNFAFTGITKPYNEQILKDALLANISQFLLEMLCKGLHNISSRKCCRLSRMDCSKSLSVTKARSFNPKNSKVTGVLITSLGCNKAACCRTKSERASLFLDSPLRS